MSLNVEVNYFQATSRPEPRPELSLESLVDSHKDQGRVFEPMAVRQRVKFG